MATVVEVLAGTAVEIVIFGIAGSVLYRVWRGASFLPQRRTMMPFNKGVVLEGERVIRVLGSGRHWIKPRQTIIAVDIRQRPFRIDDRELLTEDRQGIRIRLNGEYQVHDPAVFIQASSDGHAAFYLSIEREIPLAVAEVNRADLLERPALLADRIRERIEPRAAQLGITLNYLGVSNLIPIAWAQQSWEQ